MRIGLFGGSFNPAHEGHRLASLIALRRLRLDRVWWLVSPGNPLKDPHDLQRLDARLDRARAIARHPQIDVTAIEATLGLRYTADILRVLTQRCPGVRFVWIMGADNLRSFPRWHRWTDILRTVPIAVVDRPGDTIRGRQGQAWSMLQRWRIPEHAARSLAALAPPAIVTLHGPRSPQSSTALRRAALRRDGRGGPPGSS
ncbi:nicotinate-nucleotide adenylyltransferase [Lichenihabitans sp. Uapishka_5]|nr:nicotinate-nucleotide adenylyltransferase [Lichenihabitans sp. Uapishka_5]MDX7949971.1 nicotinate-nucleotide adenylyltransferase [Lichenihabitans sp. Uapishka_5]